MWKSEAVAGSRAGIEANAGFEGIIGVLPTSSAKPLLRRAMMHVLELAQWNVETRK